MKKSLDTVAALTEVNDGYPILERVVRTRLESTPGPWFTTDADGTVDLSVPGVVSTTGLAADFLNNLPDDRRQHYTCRCCLNFINRYGGLVTINEYGVTLPVVWTVHDPVDVPPLFEGTWARLWKAVSQARVTGVFVSSLKTLGTPKAGGWTHLSGVNPRPYTGTVRTDTQRIAELAEDYKMVRRTLADYNPSLLAEAVRVLTADVLYRSEVVVGQVTWLADLAARVAATKARNRADNLVWLAVAAAPPGFAHARSGVLSTLLDDLKAGKSFEEVRRRWAEKTHPQQYRRPTSAPTHGAVAEAEKLVDRLNLRAAFARRFARLEDVTPHAYWTPTPVAAPSMTGGLFDGLRRKPAAVAEAELPARTVTWEKFRREVLPTAVRLEVRVPHGSLPMIGFVTAADPHAPPILQYDLPDRRNPVSWYYAGRNGHSPVRDWNLTPGTWATVTAACDLPCHWVFGGLQAHRKPEAVLLLDGCRHVAYDKGAGLFPELLRSDLHGVSRVVEAYSRDAIVAGKDEATACGLAMPTEASTYRVMLRTTVAGGGTALYEVDRFD